MNQEHKPALPAFLALLAALLALPANADDSGGTAWLPLGEVVRRLEAAGYRNIEKVEREHGLYEARATGRDGERVKLTVHPRTGEIARYGARREGGGALERDGRPPAPAPECTKRRCRDDLPAPLPATGRGGQPAQ